MNRTLKVGFRSAQRPARLALCGLAGMALFAGAGQAQTIVFDNSCGTQLWQSSCSTFVQGVGCVCSNNWTTGTTLTEECGICPAYPGPGDDVLIGNIFVTNNSSVSIHNLTTTTLFRNTGGLSVSGTAIYAGPVTSIGNFGGSGTHIFNELLTAEVFQTQTDVFFPATAILNGGLEIPEGAGFGVYGRVFNETVTHWRGAGGSSFFIDGAYGGGPQCVFFNQPGALFVATGDALMRGIIGLGHFDNLGVFRKQGGVGTTEINVEFKNRPGATLDIRTGTLEFSRESTFEGVAVVAPGAVLKCSEVHGVATEFNVTGPGAFLVEGGILTVATGATLNAVNFDLDSDSSAGYSALRGNGTTNVSGTVHLSGRWADNGTINLLPGCEGAIDGVILDLENAFTINNRGHLVWSSSNLALAGGASVNNLPGGVLECTDALFMSGYGFSGTGTFNNSGLFRKTAGGMTQIFVPFLNTGVIECLSGPLAFPLFRQSAGETKLAGGSLEADYQIQPLRFEGGSLTGTGNIRGPLDNSGATIRPGGLGAFGLITLSESFYGNGFVQHAGGTLEIEIGGDQPGITHDQLRVVSDHPFLDDVLLNGTLRVRFINGFNPTSGSFVVLDRQGPGSILGTFAATDLPPGATIAYFPDRVQIDLVGTPPCTIDFNNDGILSPDDLDEFITTYFSEPPERDRADYNHDGVVSPDDLDEFITAYFEGC